jgi:hypothetical protein
MVDLLTPILSAMINMVSLLLGDFAMLASIENSVSKKQAYLTLLGIKSNYKVLALNGAHSSSKCNFLPLKKKNIKPQQIKTTI